ncbi:MAG: phosphate ABC transporter ATP-binding protein [Bacillota bacterium]|nr:phosphate ABC transporter ATP-binding protein [Bacillota bacterium]
MAAVKWLGEPKSPKVALENLSVSYQGRPVLKHVSLVIPEGRLVAIIGPSGSGKSALLYALNRMNETLPETRTEGRVLLNGENIYAPGVDLQELRRRVPIIFPRPIVFPQSIYDNVAFGLRYHGLASQGRVADLVFESLRLVGLWDEVKGRLHRSALELTAGQRQLLCIARALALQPEVLLLDEPCGSLDAISTLRVENLIQELKGRYTMVVVTHNMQEAARISDETGFLLEGELVEYGSTEQIFTQPQDERTEQYLTGRLF